MSFNANANVTLNPGIYYIDGGSLTLNGGAVVRGTGVTLVFTKKSGSSWPTATINGGATLNLTPPTTGPTAGIVMFGDRNMPLGTSFRLTGGSNLYLGAQSIFPMAQSASPAATARARAAHRSSAIRFRSPVTRR
jgi:hypothetical protein